MSESNNLVTYKKDRYTKERNSISNCYIEALGTKSIEIGNGNKVDLEIDADALKDYFNRKMIGPLPADFPSTWVYVFDPKYSLIKDENFLANCGGYTLPGIGYIYINVPRLFESKSNYQESVDKLKQNILEVIAHETMHAAFYSSLEKRAEQKATGAYRAYFYQAGKVFAYVAPAGVAKLASIGNARRMSRRDFLKVAGISIAGGFMINKFQHESLGYLALSFFDRNVDQIHKLCYAEEKNWREAQNAVKNVRITL